MLSVYAALLSVALLFVAASVGAPVFDATGAMVATIWISGQKVVLPKEKFDKYGEIVKEHAMRVSERLGYKE